MWKNIIKSGIVYAITGPLICGAFVSILIFGIMLATDTPITAREIGAGSLIIIGWSYVVGFMPAFLCGVLITRTRLGLDNGSKKRQFTYGLIGTSAVLVIPNLNFITVKPELLSVVVLFSILGGLATIFIERVLRKFA